jgi:hypothetical protein
MVGMNVNRLIRHLWSHGGKVGHFFSKDDLNKIKLAIGLSESKHSGQICFAVEGALELHALLNDLSPRDRAIEVFSNLKVWDTEHNNGVLIYVLLADRSVEIVADRGIHSKTDADVWSNICREIEPKFSVKECKSGVLSAIEKVSQHLQKHFPKSYETENEISDEPILLDPK